jgi:hypothetical protein
MFFLIKNVNKNENPKRVERFCKILFDAALSKYPQIVFY